MKISLFLIAVFLAGCTVSEDRALRKERERVLSLITVGQDFDEAQNTLREKGYKLFYEEPIQPTSKKDYYQQLVVIGNTNPNLMETVSYVTNKNLPGTRSESPYVIINADLNGKIIKIR